MQRRTGSSGGELAVFLGIATASFLSVHLMGLFQPASSFRARLDALSRAPTELAAAIARQWNAVGGSSELPTSLREPLRYRVQPGDTLSGIAARHDLTLRELIRANQLQDPDRLEVGQILSLPGRETPELHPIAELIETAEEELRAARFEEALHSAKAAERLLASIDARSASTHRARLEVARATAQLAYGNEVEARRSLERALRADPRLELDPESTPRKLRRLFVRVR